MARLSATEVRELEAAGTIAGADDGAFVLSDAGHAQVRRAASRPEEACAAQHQPVIDRLVVDEEARARTLRGFDRDRLLRRLATLRDSAGKTWFNAAELAAAARLRADWELGEIGVLRGSDLCAPPRGSAPRGPGSDGALAAQCDARRRVADALDRLAPPLRTVVERVCLREEGLEMLERVEAWPARSGKLALKLALAQLAAG